MRHYMLNRVSRTEARHLTFSRLEPMGPGSRSLPHLSTAKAELPKRCSVPVPDQTHNYRRGPTPQPERLSAMPAPQCRKVKPLLRVLRCVLLHFVRSPSSKAFYRRLSASGVLSTQMQSLQSRPLSSRYIESPFVFRGCRNAENCAGSL